MRKSERQLHLQTSYRIAWISFTNGSPINFRDKLSYGNSRVSGRPRQNWNDVVKKDLRKMGISWDEVEEAAEDRRSWKNRVAQCVFDAG